jgi:hypothetical protein
MICLLMAVLCLCRASVLQAQTSSPPFAVVELFTSEGCSTCPPAEKVLYEIGEEAKNLKKNIYCLEFHVDYWNRAGWKDPFSKNQYTMRQNAYSSVLQQRELYTPQMIINGEREFTGSDRERAKTEISHALNVKKSFNLSVVPDSVANDTVYIRVVSGQSGKNLSLHVAVVEDGLSSRVTKGENSGTTFTHRHVVRMLYTIALNEKNKHSKIPLNRLKLNKNCRLISFVQDKQTMNILAVSGQEFGGTTTR